MQRLRLIVAGVAIAGAVAGVVGLRTASRSARPSRATEPAPPAAVTVAVARRIDVVTRVLAPGSVVSIRDAKIGSRISGRVASVLVEEGAHVAAGAPLVRLDTGDLEAQQAQARASVDAARAQLQKVLAGPRPQERQQSTDAVAQARAALVSAQASQRLAEANLERERSLEAQGAVSRQDLDAAETQAQVTRAQATQAQAAYDSAVQNASLVHTGAREEDILAARAQLAQAESGLAAVRVQIRDATVTAPFNGTVTRRNVEPGETVSSSASSASPLLVLSQVDDVYVLLAVPARHRSELAPGQEAEVGVDGVPGRTFRGRVEMIEPTADAPSRTFGVKVRVPNPDGTLRPGMFARGAIAVAVRRGVLQIPDRAVITAASGPLVFVVRDGRAVRRSVALGTRQAGLVEVTSGLSDGDRVVVAGQEALTDQQPVTSRTP